jgi:hypothetical protein
MIKFESQTLTILDFDSSWRWRTLKLTTCTSPTSQISFESKRRRARFGAMSSMFKTLPSHLCRALGRTYWCWLVGRRRGNSNIVAKQFHESVVR